MNRVKRREFLYRMIAGLIVLGGSGCATTIDTFVDYDRQVDFSEYKTFSWVSEHPLIVPPIIEHAANPFTESRIQDAISSELRARGFTFKPVGSDVDFVVSFSITARKEISVESYPVAYRGRWGWGGATIGESVSVDSTTEGTLSIDIFDEASKSPAWHGWARKKLTTADKRLRSSIISDAVAEILKGFPPTAS